MTKTNLSNDKIHFKETHERWVQRINRKQSILGYHEEWTTSQCMFCQYYILLQGSFAFDWGVCSHPQSPFDGMVRFEHDGCYYFSEVDTYDGEE